MCRTSNKNKPADYKPLNGGKWIRPDKRLAIYLRDDFRCVYCERDLRDADPADLTLDHLKPRSLGGKNGSDNLATSCRSCNSSRGNKPALAFADTVHPDARPRILRNRKRSLIKYRKMAQSLIAGQSNTDIESAR